VLQDTADREEVVARVAALDIGKAEVVCPVPKRVTVVGVTRLGDPHWTPGNGLGAGRTWRCR
jgi:hypothetical protein